MEKVMAIRASNDGTPFIIDAQDYEMLRSFRWSHDGNGYAVTGRAGGGTISMHRMLLNDPEDKVVDHINRKRRDCRRENLRAITPMQNAWNRTPIASLSGFKGVALRHGKWVATIQCERTTYYIGAFEEAELAALAYNDMARELHGEYAVLNEVTEHARVFKHTAIDGRGEI
ncbi:MAG: HNH endonuclease [Actinobacteria bacterium]|nr:HNH endonuclease [Actinomycetota bacterium]